MEAVEAVTANGGAGDALGTNGLSEEELERQRMRPADVDADMREMSRRKRVEAVLQSPAFRTELDRLVEAGMAQGNCVGGSTLTDMLGMVRSGPITGRGMQCVQPIADLRGVEASQLTKPEKMLRCKLASLLRVMDMFGWAQGVCNHATVRLSQDLEHFLVNPYGLLYSEMTASALLKADMQGNTVSPGSSGLGLSSAAYLQLAAIHAARPDLRCVLHVQEPSVVTVSALRAGLLPLTEHACTLGEVSVHRPPAEGADPEHQRLTRDLGVHNKVMLLQNRGALCCGETIEEAFFLLSHLVAACKSQVVMMPLGLDNLTLVDEAQQQLVFEESRRPPARADSAADTPEERPSARNQWRLGELEFEALMRVMDNAGYRTGHIYRHALRPEPPAHQSDVEYPPAASSHTADIDDIFRYSPMRKSRPGERTRWLNTPNVYQKVEMLETGTNDPKTIYKWVPDGSPSHGNTPIKVDAALQFVPKNTNPKEFKQLQQQIKENRRGGGVSAGPQSHILEGVSWDEARQLQEAAEQRAGGDQVVLVGAASKGIIQRNYQHNATVYKTPYAQNPFDRVTDEDLEEYKRFVDQKSRGASVEAEIPPPSAEVPAAQHAERVQLPSDGEEADVSRSSAPGDVTPAPAPAGRVESPPFSPSDHEALPPLPPRTDRVSAVQVPRAAQAHAVTLAPDGSVSEGDPESPRYLGGHKQAPLGSPASLASPLSPSSPTSPPSAGSPASPGHGGGHFPLPPAENPRVRPVPPVRAPVTTNAAPADRGAAPRDLTANGDETDTGHMSTVSHTDQEDISTSEASKKDKKKKKGLRTPSFLKKKKDKKKDKEASK